MYWPSRTRQGAELLTLRYASPEQVRGEVATTGADIYALGVVLYELLTGRSPYALRGTSTAELMRAIADTEPSRPSAAARLAPDAIQGVGFDYARLAGELRGDLDAIVLKCLRKDPGSRYSSAAELADDLERHLARLPVRAHRGSVGYRARKFFARHTAAIVGVAAFLLLLIASVVALSLQLERTRLERDKSQRIAAFLVDLIAQADPSRSSGETVTVREALARGNARLAQDTQLPDDTRALLRSTMGGALHQIGLYAMAESLLGQAAAHYETTAAGGAEHTEAVSLLSSTRLELGKLPEASESAERALSLAQARSEADPALLGRVAYRTGIVRLRQGKRDEARAAFEASRAAWTQAGKGEGPEAAEALNGLANWARDSGDSRVAEQYFSQALALIRRGPRNDWAEARSLNNLAVLRLDQSDLEGAEKLLREALPPMRHALGDEHPVVAGALSNLGGVLNRAGNFAEAAEVFDASIAIRRKLLGAQHPLTASTESNRAWNDYSLGKFAAAEDSMRAALDVQLETLGAAHQHTLITQRNLAAVLFARGNLEQAHRQYVDMLASARPAVGEDHPLVWVSRERDALIAALLGEPERAGQELQDVMDAQEKKLGPSHLETAETRIALALSLLLSDQHDAGCRMASQGVTDFERHLGPGHPDRLLGEALAGACRSRGEPAPALEALRARYGESHPLIAALRTIQHRLQT